MTKYLIGFITWSLCAILMAFCGIQQAMDHDWLFVGISTFAAICDIINARHDFKKWKETQ